MIISAFFPDTGLGIYSYFFMVEMYSIMYVYPIVYPFTCASTINFFFWSWLLYMEKEMATHSSVLAWRIPWTEKPGRLQSVGSHRVGHD